MFVKGQSGNISGRPSLPEELKTKLRENCPGVLDFWIATYENENESFSNRNKAAENIWNYAYGKPKELIDIDMNGKIEGLTIEIVKRIDNES
jgi:hypothetical protein